jgi:UDP-N-acetylmuramate--alanine ligase
MSTKIHLIGIGGIGLSAIAKFLLKRGAKISGSDITSSEITNELEKKGVKIFIGHQEKNLRPETNLVIYSPAISSTNPERQKAYQLKIPQLSYPQFLGKISQDKQTIAVSGTNGKSTTTALLGLMLKEAEFNPLVIVGSRAKTFSDGNLEMGEGNYFVVEACEWQANMLNLHPKIIVLTNIERDHLYYYRNISHIIETFQKYINKLSTKDQLILNIDDPVISQKLKRPNCRVITYGIKNKADLTAKNIRIKNERQFFDLKWRGKTFSASLQTPGQFNIYNALAAAACALSLGVNQKIIKKVLASFQGLWRRFEKVGKYEGAIIISDYAHHPTAVSQTIQAAREFWPKRRIVAVFQPHHYNRTKKLFNNFVKSFDQADLIILNEIFEVAGRENKEDQNISSKDLVKAIERRVAQKSTEKKVLFGENLEKTKQLILDNLTSDDLILIMGAGNIYTLTHEMS